MKKSTLLIFIIFFVNSLMAQDLDIYRHSKNSNFKMPHINKGMTYKEFQLLSRDLRMQDMLYAMVVPGYTHFVAQDKKTGYWVLGTRLVGYAGLSYVILKNDFTLTELISGVNVTQDAAFKNQQIVAYTSLAIILGSYFYDWIHGKWVLKKKQEAIRYKYSIRMNASVETSRLPNHPLVPGVKFTLTLD
ncbi:MAG: hypothetical protein JXR65_05535 [Bacteroidales bacterium]|nr:hypothetical protein [Bacteroidales bacterium]